MREFGADEDVGLALCPFKNWFTRGSANHYFLLNGLEFLDFLVNDLC